MSIELKVPNVGESIQEVQIGQWLKHEGDSVRADESVVELETDKASLDVSAPADGVIVKITKRDGERVSVGEVIGYLDAQNGSSDGGQKKASQPAVAAAATSEKRSKAEKAEKSDKKDGRSRDNDADERRSKKKGEIAITPSARRALREYGLKAEDVEAAGKRLRREDVLRHVERQEAAAPEPAAKQAPPPAPTTIPAVEQRPAGTVGRDSYPRPAVTPAASGADAALEEAVPMSLIRRRIARRLVEAQQNAALLTTFNEIDMSSVMALRKEHGERFREKYDVKLGFMSFFVKAAIDALKLVPAVNAEIRGDNIVYRNYYHVGIAIGGSRGLVVPVLRHAERLSFAEVEKAIADFAQRADARKLEPQELEGGTFTISNGGTYGSLLSTPIVNPPQSGVLGMHTIQERPVARGGQVVIRPMMYVALSYDHRLIDGREAVTFLKRIKETIEDPARMLLEA